MAKKEKKRNKNLLSSQHIYRMISQAEDVPIDVVQDILNLPYSIDSYYDKLDEFTDVELAKFKQKYVDEVYTTYQKASIADGDLKGKTFEDILTDLSAANTNGLFAIAKELSELYYPLYGKELFTLDSLKDDVEEAL